MKTITEILQQSQTLKNVESGFDSTVTYEDSVVRKIEFYNSSQGYLTGYDCEKCLNRGSFHKLRGGSYIVSVQCECILIRQSLKNIEQSGLKHLLDVYTFDNYKTVHDWQSEAKALAMWFLENHIGNWFFIGGAIGSGKTHLCTAIVGSLLKQGLSAKYMLWRNEIMQLKSVRNESDAFESAIRSLQTVDVLYIDDFFKSGKHNNPTDSDVDIAFEILGYRYNDEKYTTIISSELLPEEIDNISESIGSRIYQRSKGYCIGIDNDKSKNHRYKQFEEESA